MQAADFFADEWPRELPRLRRLLAANGIPADDVDDVLQESAARLYAAWGRVFEDRPIRPLVTTIVLNCARDHHRRARARIVPVPQMPDALLVDPQLTDRVALSRLEVGRAGRALARLTDQQRKAVVDAVSEELRGEEAGRRRAPAAARMALTRARRQLATALELTAGVGAVIAMGARRVTSSAGTPAAAMAIAGAATLAAVLVSPASHAPSAPMRVQQAMSGTADVTQTAATHNQGQLHLQGFSASGSAAPFSGVSGWVLRARSPLVGLDALGYAAQVGTSEEGQTCGLAVAGVAWVGVRCEVVV